MFVPTLNIAQAAQRFREAGIATSSETLGTGIEQGLFPFAICIKTELKNGEEGRRFFIYETLLDDYLLARSDQAPPDRKIAINNEPNIKQIRAIVLEVEKLNEQKRNSALKAVTEEMIKIIKLIH
jgi:hypothetical protein